MEKIDTIADYLKIIEDLLDNTDNPIQLFRGQSENFSLLPGIARNGNNYDSTDIEKEMLSDFKRSGNLLFNSSTGSDWDLLVMAQHFKMQTRLLDWSSNPLIALWFAISSPYHINKDGMVYFLNTDNSYILDKEDISKGPFEIEKTKILNPTLNNNRIIAQNGWFTAHNYSNTSKKFVPLDEDEHMKNLITTIKIPSKSKQQLIKSLSTIGINNRTVFPDIEGLCLHLNWIHTPMSVEVQIIAKLKRQLKKDISNQEKIVSQYIKLKFPQGFSMNTIKYGGSITNVLIGFIKEDLEIDIKPAELHWILRKYHFNPEIR